MSISSEITRISDNVSDALDAIESKGVTIPAGANSDDLSSLISSIRTGSSVVVNPTLLTGTDIASISVDGDSTTLYAPTPPSKTSDLTNDSGYITGMVELSYGSSTWNDFITAYNAKKVVYCRASSNSNPASGSQTRKAFMAYVDNAETPTNVEFQYYRSVSTHTDSQQGDQVYVYKLTKSSGWSVTVREAYSKIATGTGISKSYSNGTITLSSTVSVPTASDATPENLGTAAAGSSTDYSRADHVHAMPTASDVGALPSSTVIPSKVSDLTNDSGFVNSSQAASAAPVQSVNGETGAVTVAVPSAATATPSNLGTAAVGTSTKYAKEDHVHNYPDIVHVGSSAPADTNIELWLDNSSGGNSVVSSVDGKTGTVTVLPSGGTTGQVLKKVSGTSYDVTWANESGSVTSVDGKTGVVNVLPVGGAAGKVLKKKTNSDYDVEWSDDSGGVTSVNGMTGDVTVPTIAVQDNAPSGGELVWIDTDDSGQSITIPQIDDSSVSTYDTWSSQKIRDFIYPIGSIYMSVNSTSPATIFGGTWEQIQDTFLLAAGSTYAAGTTGGAATHAHTTGDCTLTVNQIPSHRHLISANANTSVSGGYSGMHYTSASTTNGASAYEGGGKAHNHGNTGSSSNMPPYLAVYVWKRTA